MVEPSKDPILFRCSKLKQIFTGKSTSSTKQPNIVTIDGLLDGFLILYDECNSDHFQDQDKYSNDFVKKFRNSVAELKGLRVNISDFEVHKIIGRGHFGDVQVVREKQTGEIHAMKILKKKDTLDQKHMAFYEEERDIMATAQSPWITQLHYAFQDQNHLYLVMEFHPGGDLLSLMDRQDTLNENDTRFYLAEMTLAIHSLHQMGYVHRDIKPENILIDRLGHIKLADFGSAAKLNSSGKVDSKMPVGTLDYVSPEVIDGLNGKQNVYGVECDWWSLGIVGYELLCGQTPFSEEKESLTCNNILSHKKTFKWPIDIDFSNDMKNVIENLLQDASQRYGFNDLYKHKLFVSFNWNDMRNMIPPFVPKVLSQDDTSNFEEFERRVQKPNLEDFKMKKGFSGKNLPFVGFTFTNVTFEENNEKKRSTPRLRRSEKFEPDVKLEAKLRRVSSVASEKETENKIAQLQKLLDDKQEELNTAKEENEKVENDLTKCLKEISKLKRFLEFERNERLLNEKKALQLITDAKDKWKREEESLRSELQKRESYVADIEPKHNELQYQKKLVDAMSAELTEAKKRMEQYKNKVNQMMENKKDRNSRVHVMLDGISTEKDAEIEKLKEKLDEMADYKKDTQEKLLAAEKTLKQKEELIGFLEKERDCYASSERENEEKLMSVQEKCSLLEGKIAELESNSIDLTAREFAFQELQKALAEEREHTRAMQEKVEAMDALVQKSISAQHGTLAKIQEEMSAEIQGLALEKKEVDNTRLKLEIDLQAAQEKQREHCQQIEELKIVINDLEKATAVESEKKRNVKQSKENSNPNPELESKITKLETQLERARELTSSERQRARDLQEELRKVQKENSDVKLDLRISQREVKKAQEKISELENSIKTLESSSSEAQTRMAEIKAKEDELTDSLKNIEVQLAVKKQELQKQEELAELEKNKLESRIQQLEESSKKNNTLQSKVDKLQYQNDELLKQKSMLEDQIKLMDELKQQHKLDENGIRQELESVTTKCKTIETAFNKLKTTCTILEGQLEDFEVLVENHEEQEVALRIEKETFTNRISELEKELEVINCTLAKEIANKNNLEKERDNLQRVADTMKAAQAAKSNTLKDELNEQKAAAMQYYDELNDLEQKLITAERARETFRQRSEILEKETAKIKEEATALITKVHALQDSNLKLTVGLGEAIEKCEFSKDRITQLENDLESEQVAHNVAKVRLQATIDQQSKLINFLQSKTEGLGKKKKTFQEKIFGRSAKPAPTSKEGLDKEKLATWRGPKLHSQSPKSYDNIGFKPPTPQTKGVLSALMQSPGNQHSPDGEIGPDPNPTEERMRHNIPHRFQNSLSLRATKCGACFDTIHFVNMLSKCQECQLTVHPRCATNVPGTCGLPTGFIQHFRKSLRKRSLRNIRQFSTSEEMVKGWVKIPRANKQSWEEKFAVIDGNKLKIFDKENSDSGPPTDVLDLCPVDGESVVHGAVLPTELSSTAKSDLAYILKLELIPQTTCWPGKMLYLMAPNFEEKMKWVSALENVVKEHASKSKKIKEAKLLGSVILRGEGENILDVNCLIHLDSKLILIGAEEGLFYVEVEENKPSKKPRQILGIDSVFQLEVIDHLRCLVLIINHERELCQVDLPQIHDAILNNVEVEPVSIENMCSCHLFAQSTNSQGTFLCAATVEKISLCIYKDAHKAFCLKKEFMSGRPCSCLHFTRNSVIVGTDKYFEIDLKNLTAEEFLDTSDVSLKYTNNASALADIFPVAVLRTSQPNEEDEFLLCFHEIGIFVDGFGRRSRKGDLKWTRLPLSFAFEPPYLFITHFNSIEIAEIKSQSHVGKCKNTFLDISNPRYLGRHPSYPGCIYLASFQEQNMDIFYLQGNLINSNPDLEAEGIQIDDGIDTETVCTSSSSEFSFSSSIMNIIEGSEVDSSDYSHIVSIAKTPQH